MTACSSVPGPNSCRPTSSRTAIRPPCSGFPTCIASSDETTDEILCQRLARDRAPPTRHPCTALGHGRHSGRLGQRDPLSGDHRTQDAAASAHGIAPATRVAGAAAPGGTGGGSLSQGSGEPRARPQCRKASRGDGRALVDVRSDCRSGPARLGAVRSEEHTSELQSPDTISYAVFCLKKKKQPQPNRHHFISPETQTNATQ